MHLQDSMTRLTAAVVETVATAPILQALAATTLLEQHHHQQLQPLVLHLNQKKHNLYFF
jgi:hypothetical protein